jgi:hypothetical protein
MTTTRTTINNNDNNKQQTTTNNKQHRRTTINNNDNNKQQTTTNNNNNDKQQQQRQTTTTTTTTTQKMYQKIVRKPLAQFYHILQSRHICIENVCSHQWKRQESNMQANECIHTYKEKKKAHISKNDRNQF